MTDDHPGHRALEALAARRRWARMLTERGDPRGQLLEATLEPGEAAWNQLTEALDAVPEPQLEPIIGWLEGYLKAWPDPLRRLPERWLDALRDGEPCPCARLARHLERLGPIDPTVLVKPELAALTHVTLREPQEGDDEEELTDALCELLEAWAEAEGVTLTLERRPPAELIIIDYDDPASPETTSEERVVDRGEGIVIEYDPEF